MIEEPIPQEPIQIPIEETMQETTKPNWRIWIAASGCAVLLCAAVFVGTLIVAGPKFIQRFIPENINAAENLPPMEARSNTMGSPDAPVRIIEYGDYQCPYCLKFWSETEPLLIEEYVNTSKVYFEYRSVGEFLGAESGWAAQGAYCAGDQGKFWEYHNTLFSNWSGENVGDFTQDKLIKYAQALDLNMAEFESCISEEKHKGTVEQDAAQAEADGVHATPTLFINGVKYEGAQPYHALKYLIDQALNGNLNEQSG
ncbi:MAG: DsbA family protein [Chloroflexi bacterium]|nr:DsbA family protein [Chloroflexota bacterium]